MVFFGDPRKDRLFHFGDSDRNEFRKIRNPASDRGDTLPAELFGIGPQYAAHLPEIGRNEKRAMVEKMPAEERLCGSGDFTSPDRQVVPARKLGFHPHPAQNVEYRFRPKPEFIGGSRFRFPAAAGQDKRVIEVSGVVINRAAARQAPDHRDPLLLCVGQVNFAVSVLMPAENDRRTVLPQKKKRLLPGFRQKSLFGRHVPCGIKRGIFVTDHSLAYFKTGCRAARVSSTRPITVV